MVSTFTAEGAGLIPGGGIKIPQATGYIFVIPKINNKKKMQSILTVSAKFIDFIYFVIYDGGY